jgi:hypothetical protein
MYTTATVMTPMSNNSGYDTINPKEVNITQAGIMPSLPKLIMTHMAGKDTIRKEITTSTHIQRLINIIDMTMTTGPSCSPTPPTDPILTHNQHTNTTRSIMTMEAPRSSPRHPSGGGRPSRKSNCSMATSFSIAPSLRDY